MDVFRRSGNRISGSVSRLGRQLAWGVGLILSFLLVATGINHLHLGQIHRTWKELNENLNEQKFLTGVSLEIAACQEWECKMRNCTESGGNRTQAREAWLAASKALLDVLAGKRPPNSEGVASPHWKTWEKWAQEYVDSVLGRLGGNYEGDFVSGIYSGKDTGDGPQTSPPSGISGQEALEALRRAVDTNRNRAQAEGQSLEHRLQFLLARHTRWTAAWTVVGLGCVGIAVLWIGVYVLRRVRRLTQAATRLADGHDPIYLQSPTQDELGQLACQLNRLAEKLSQVPSPKEQKASPGSSLRRQWSQWIARSARRLLGPLEKIQTHSEILVQNLHLPEYLQAIGAIEQNALFLRTMTESCEYWAQLEAGVLKPEPKPFAPRRLLTDLIHAVQPLASAKGVALQLQWEDSPQETFVSDPVLLEKVLMYELTWAVEKTELGEIQLRAKILCDRNPVCLHIQVVSPVPGMALEETASATDSSSSRSREDDAGPPGETIGWYVCRSLAKLLGGEIEIQSLSFGESVFALTLPMLEAAAPSSAAEPTSLLEPRPIQNQSPPVQKVRGRVLLAEDGPENQRLISFILRKAGLQVDIASDGQEAVQRVLQQMDAAAEPPYDLILMDMLMPRMDGFQATRRLRQAGYQGPILAITGLTESYSCPKCLEAGCNEYLAKPLEREKLLTVLAKYLQASQAETLESAAAHPF